MDITGKVHEISATQQVTESFKKRDIIIAYAENPEFVEYVRFEATQDRTAIFNGLNVGDEVNVRFNLRGRPWTNKDGVTTYFNSLVAWKVEKIGGAMEQNENPTDFGNEQEEDDLPF